MTLCDLGFNEYQEQLYWALLADQCLSIGDLGQLIGAGDESTRAELAGLVQLGVLEVDPGAAAGVRVVHPMSALRKHVEQAEDELLRRQWAVSDIRIKIELLSNVYSRRLVGTGERCEQIETVDGVSNKLRDLYAFTMTSLYAVQPGGPRSAASIAATRPLDLRALGRGVDLRVIYQCGVLEDEANRAYLAELAAAGAKIRLANEELDQIIIMDGRIAVVAIDPANSRRGALVVRHACVTTVLDRLFARLWVEAEPLHRLASPVVAPREPEVSDAERRLLGLLASGQTDEAAARELGVSVRHLRRRIAALMRRLGASSRFEAGVLAAHRSWI